MQRRLAAAVVAVFDPKVEGFCQRCIDQRTEMVGTDVAVVTPNRFERSVLATVGTDRFDHDRTHVVDQAVGGLGNESVDQAGPDPSIHGGGTGIGGRPEWRFERIGEAGYLSFSGGEIFHRGVFAAAAHRILQVVLIVGENPLELAFEIGAEALHRISALFSNLVIPVGDR